MKKFREYISEEVVPSALVANGTIDIDNEDVRASINLALAKVTSDGAITPYIALNRISKALSYFHIILPKRIYLEGAKGVEVHEIRQFGHKMGMTDQGEFVHEVPGKYYLFMQYNMNSPMPYGGQLAYPNMGGTFRVMAKVVDKVELDRLVSMAELALAEECDAEMQQKRAKMLAPHETMHDVTSDEKKKGNKAAVATSEKKKVNEGWVALGPRGASSVYDKFGDVRPGTKWYGRRPPKANKPGDAEPGAGDTYKGSKQGGKTRFAKSVKEGAVGDFLNSMNPLKRAGDAIDKAMGTGGASASPKPDMRIMTPPTKPIEKKPPKEGSPQSSFPSVNEGRMPASVIKHKQKLANMTPEEKAKKFAGKSEEELKSIARRHGYGKDSIEYSKHVKEETINEISHKLALKAMKKSEKRGNQEYERDMVDDRLSDPDTHYDRAKRLRGHMRKKFGNDKPGRGNRGGDRLADGPEGRNMSDRLTHGKRAGLPSRRHVTDLKSNIKFSLGKHHKPNLPEETQIDELYGRGKLNAAIQSHLEKKGWKKVEGKHRSGESREKSDIVYRKGKRFFSHASSDVSSQTKSSDDGGKTWKTGVKKPTRWFRHTTGGGNQPESRLPLVVKAHTKDLKKGRPSKGPGRESSTERVVNDAKWAQAVSDLGKRKKMRDLGVKGFAEDYQLDELKQETVRRYKKAAESDKRSAESSAETSRWHKKNRALPLASRIAHGNEEKWLKGIAKKREKGIAMADKRLEEKAPPGAKFERMVKHIKAGYAKDGLTKKEKGIAYATAWKAKKRESED